MPKKIITIFLSIFLATVISACGSSSSDGQFFLRVLHASPDAPAVDVLFNGEIVLSDVSYKESSGYLRPSAGTGNIMVNAAGTSTTVIDVTTDFARNSAITVLAVNFLNSIEPLVLTDDLSQPEEGNAAIRVVHASPSAGTVDIYVTAPGADLSGAEPVLTGVPFKAISDYLNLPPGDYQIRVTATGTTTVAIDTGAVTVADGDRFTAAALDAEGGGDPFMAILLADKLQ